MHYFTESDVTSFVTESLVEAIDFVAESKLRVDAAESLVGAIPFRGEIVGRVWMRPSHWL